MTNAKWPKAEPPCEPGSLLISRIHTTMNANTHKIECPSCESGNARFENGTNTRGRLQNPEETGEIVSFFRMKFHCHACGAKFLQTFVKL